MRIEARQWWFDVRRRLRGMSLARAARTVRVLLPAIADQRRRTLVLVIVVGLGVAVLASALAWLARTLEHGRMELIAGVPYWAQCVLLVLFPTLGAVVIGSAVHFLAPSDAGSGVPLVKASYHLKAGELEGRSIISKTLLNALTIGSGLSLGREGPSVHVGAAFGSWVGQRLAIQRARIKMLSAVGAACGVAAAFNAPIAAILFVMEEIVNDLRHALVGGLVVAVVLSSAAAMAIVGDQPLLGEVTHGFFSAELIAYVPLGIAAGLFGRVFVWAVLWSREVLAARPMGYRGALRRFLVGGFSTGAITMLVFVITGLPVLGSSGLDAIAPLLTLGLPALTLLILCAGKLVATASSFMTSAPGGVFGPSLFIGAMLGSLVAHGVNAVVPHLGLPPIDLGAMAVVGMAALFGGVARCPLTASMIVVEITDDYALILPLMLATTLSVLIVQSRFRGSIYDLLLRQDGIVVHAREHAQILSSTTVEEVMTTEIDSLSGELAVDAALAVVDTREAHRLYVVTGPQGLMIGVVSPTDLVWEVARGRGGSTLGEFVEGRRIIHCHPDQELDVVMEKITHFEFTEFPVVPRDNERRVIGFVGLHEITLFRQQLGK